MNFASILFALLGLWFDAAPLPRYEALRTEAESRYAEKSFARAHALYADAAKLDLPAAERRWVELRLADTTWRADAANPAPDDTARKDAAEALEDLIRKSDDDHDRIWAEAQESLGDYFETHPQQRDISSARSHYVLALDWWAGSDDLALARGRYLSLVWKLATATWGREEDANAVGRDILANAAAIADTPQDRAHARYLLSLVLLNSGDAASAERGFQLLEQVIAEGRSTAFYDDALFTLGQQLESRGAAVVLENGEPGFRADYVKALAAYRRLLAEFKEGETRYWRQAQQRVDNITHPDVDLIVGGNFLPRSEQEVALSARNVKEAELTITALDLTNDVELDVERHLNLSQAVRTEGRPVVRRWTVETGDRGDYAPLRKQVRLTPPLEPGAYAMTARSGGVSNRIVFLVSDVSIVVHSTPSKMAIFVASVLTGEPLGGARIRVWQHREKGIDSRIVQADANGLANVEVVPDANGQTLITAAGANGRQAYHEVYSYGRGRRGAGTLPWRVYAFTDRPAYRPDETVHWKIVARIRGEEQWTTPQGRVLTYEIISPRGENVAAGSAPLNEFGSFWADLPLTASMPLGSYRIRFRAGEQWYVSDAELFRLEEYKLPEFRVSVTTPEEGGKRKLYRLGETIDATIEASYYFGGAVANATIEAVVYDEPFYRVWHPYREYPWFYDDDQSAYRYGYGGGTIVKRETLHTDESGRATLHIQTPADGRDRRYRIEARVVDASRREVTGQGTVNVTRQRYSVYANPRHYIHRAGEQVSIEFKAMDANDQPVQVTGNVTVTRRAWLREEQKYSDDEIASGKATTDANGEATFTFTPPRDGYYAVHWTSEDRTGSAPLRAGDIVIADTMVFVARESSTDLGYFFGGGIEIVLDRETVRAGETTPVMIVTPASGRWVLLTTSGDEMFDTRVLHLDGTVKLVPLKIDDRHIPNFHVTATTLFDRGLSNDAKTIVVPPVAHFLDVTVTPDRAEYEPRQKGSVTVTTRDVDGRPVAAEVALSVSDESVTAIGKDPAGDPRQFFFGEKRGLVVQVSAGLQSQQFIRYVLRKDGQLIDDRILQQLKKDGRDESDEEKGVEGGVVGGVFGGVAGGVIGGSMSRQNAPPAAKAMAQNAVAEAITVTASAPAPVAYDAAAPSQPMEIVVRHDFRSTALWKPDIITGADGTARVTLDYPEALTTWRATARAATAGSAFGMGSATSRTSMPLLVRLEAPRFFVAGDRATVSAVMNNNTDAPMSVTPSIEIEGLTLHGEAAHHAVTVPPHGDARAEWEVVAEHAGPAKLRVKAQSADRGDAMEKPFTVYEHGIDKLIARSGKIRGDEALIRLELPKERRDTTLTVQLAPSLAVTMLDALPYLIDYPYGCTEQTMSRFLPAAIVARTLAKNGLAPSDIEGRMFGGIEKPKPVAGPGMAKLGAVTAASMKRLYDFQHGDGGWGWWKDGSSDSWMTAYVVWGFAVARDGGLDVDRAAVDRAVTWLDRELVQSEGEWHEEAWLLHAIAAWRRGAPAALERKAFDDVWTHRERLTAYSRALLALAAHDFGENERAGVLVRNLEDGVKIDRTPDESRVAATGNRSTAETIATARWGTDRSWWHWYEGPVETTSFALQALVAIDPKNALIEPAMNWLVKNRRGAQWNNTRDTAIALLGLNDYLRTSGELSGDVTYELTVNGRTIASKTIAKADVLRAPARYTIDAELVRDSNEIRVHRSGGALYFAAEARFFSLEEPVKAAGNELFVRREYVRLAPRPTLLKGVVYEKVPLKDGDTLDSGDRVEVIVTVESKNDYEYLMFEDLKPAGFEAVALQSGTPLSANELRDASVTRSPASNPTSVRRAASADQTSRSVGVYQELRDRKVAMFIDHLPQGVWQIRYPLRAETPGTFHALPVIGQAMYVPEIRGNSEEVRVNVK